MAPILASYPLLANDQHKMNGFSISAGYGRTSQSRSTSAGSSPSDKASIDLHNVPSFLHGGSNAFPDYDYPKPWLNSPSPLAMMEIDYPEPFADRFVQTFQPHFLETSAEEQQVQARLLSSIRLPPGLEDMFEPEETAARIAVASATFQLPSPNAWNTHASLVHSYEVPFTYDSLPPPPQYEPRMAEPTFQFCSFPPPPLQSQPIVSTQPAPLLPQIHAAPPHPIFSTQMQRELLSFPPPEPLPRPLLDALHPREQDHLAIDGTRWPSIGSQDHYQGSCKPCAFFHRKGCGSGGECRFCHLCDSGEKKKRMKEKRDGLRNPCMSL